MSPIVVLIGLFLAPSGTVRQADLIVENAHIYTSSTSRAVDGAVAVVGGRILAVGSDVSAYAGPATVRINARGGTLTPGLIDSHAHVRQLGALLESRDLRHAATVAAIADYVRERAAKATPNMWVIGRNWDQTNWGGQFPTARDLDAAAPANPVFLSRVDGHAGWANTAALKLAGITAKTPDPPGGKIIRDVRGEATGVLIDAAQNLVRSHIPPPSYADIKRQIELAGRECARLGMTGVHDAGVSATDLRAYRELIAEGRLTVRVNAMIGGEGALWDEYRKRGPEIGEYLTVRSIKMFADGALGSRGAALWQPYSDDKTNSGLLMITEERLERVARQAVAAGFQVCTHAIGDRAVRTVLDAYAAALGGVNDRRFRVEHAQIVSLPDFELFKRYSIIPAMQPTHATSDMRWAEKRLGPDRIAGAYAWHRFLALGVPVASGSDFPVEEPNPIAGFYAAFTRQDATGNPPGGWMPTERMTRAEALASWTITGAYAAFEEHSKGTLEPGKLADFVVFDRDIMQVPPTEVLATRVRLTVLGGKPVYETR